MRLLRLIPLLTLLLLAFAGEPPQEPPQHTLYLPLQFRSRMDGLGFEVLPGYTFNQPELFDLAPLYLRSGFGDWQNPNDTLYQHYLAGGWAEVDNEVLDELELWREIGAQPLVEFMYGGACVAPTTSQLAGYGNFIVAAVARYDLNYFEVWNEPDFSSGLPSLYGCFGTQYTSRLKYLITYVQARVPAWRNVGVSFAADGQAGMTMLGAVASFTDWVGIHHYGVWGGGQVFETWPGSVALKYQMASAYGKPVWVTELNLRSPTDECGLEHQAAQDTYIQNALALRLPKLSILVYMDYPNWQCSGIKGTIAEQSLLEAYP